MRKVKRAKLSVIALLLCNVLFMPVKSYSECFPGSCTTQEEITPQMCEDVCLIYKQYYKAGGYCSMAAGASFYFGDGSGAIQCMMVCTVPIFPPSEVKEMACNSVNFGTSCVTAGSPCCGGSGSCCGSTDPCCGNPECGGSGSGSGCGSGGGGGGGGGGGMGGGPPE